MKENRNKHLQNDNDLLSQNKSVNTRRKNIKNNILEKNVQFISEGKQ